MAWLSQPLSAAELTEGAIKQGSVDNCSLRVEGPIEKGDNQRVEALLRASTSEIFNYPDFKPENQYVVCLSGPGGNYLEGIALAKTFSSFDVTTLVEDGKSCLSACAIAFLGGRINFRSGEGYSPSRVLFPGSRLGFHAPQLTVGDGEYTEQQVLAAYDVALNAISALNSNAKTLYIDDNLISEIIAHRGEDFYYVDTIDDLSHFDIRLAGHRDNPIRNDTRKAACWNAFNWLLVGDNTRMTDEEWSSVFNDNSPGFLDSSRKDIYTFYPFDGPMYCHVSRPPDAPDIGPVQIVLSELQDLSDPRGRYYTTGLALFRGNRTIDTTR